MKLWKATKQRLGPTGFLFIQFYTELDKLHYQAVWTEAGVKYLFQLYGLDNYYFKLLQLRHVVISQSRQSTMCFAESPFS